jgi:Flp pilus assembly protein TadB
MANDLQTYYDTLGLQPGASAQDVRRAYLELTKVWHPDRFADDPRLRKRAEAELKRINQAYERLRSLRPAAAPPPRRVARRRSDPQAAAQSWPARLPLPEVLGLLVVIGVLAVLAVVAVACSQLLGGIV